MIKIFNQMYKINKNMLIRNLPEMTVENDMIINIFLIVKYQRRPTKI